MFGRIAHEVGIDAVEHELGSTKHVEGPAVVDVAPRQVNEAFTAFSVHGPATKVECTIAVDNCADIEFPTGIGGIASHQVLGLRPDLDADMHVAKRCAVGIAECPSWRIRTDHGDSHDDQSGSIFARAVCAFVLG